MREMANIAFIRALVRLRELPQITAPINARASTLDIIQPQVFLNPIISPRVSTPGARPSQGGLCFFQPP